MPLLSLRWLLASASVSLLGCSLLIATDGLTDDDAAPDASSPADASTDDPGSPSADGDVPDAVVRPDGAVAKIAITAAGDHTCAAVDGVAFCWGDNANGEIGDGTKTPRPTPTRVLGLPLEPVTAISAGQTHTCAVVAGAVYCWGSGGSGELGVPNTTTQTTALKVPGLPAGQATEIAAGLGFTCAVIDDKTYCWGSNATGRLGDGTDDPGRPTPAAVVTSTGPLMNAAQISGTNDHACAMTTGGTAYCWGHNDNGALGDPGVGGYSNKAVAVLGLSGEVRRITIGGWAACALMTSGAVHCWGTGDKGELGNGGFSHSATPVPVMGLGTGVTWVATAGGPDLLDATCAIQNGKVLCWGNGQHGRLGDQGTTPRGVPAAVATLPEAALTVVGGFGHFCALLASGQIRCWGRGGAGQLGDGSSVDRPVPVQVTGL